MNGFRPFLPLHPLYAGLIGEAGVGGWKKGIPFSFLILSLGLAVLPGCGDPHRSETLTESVRFGLALQDSSALAIVADSEGMFREEGLRPTVVEYVSGSRALQAMLSGEVDMATTSEASIVFEAVQGKRFRILATLASLTGMERVVARRSSGIAGPGDLRGKRIGTQRASAVHYFLHLFLLKSGLTEQDVEVVFMQAETLPKALASGEIDAFCMREPYVSEACDLLKEDALIMPSLGLYYRTEHLVATVEIAQDRQAVAERILKALVRAEDFVRRDPRKAQEIVARRLGLSTSDLASRWPDFELRVSLDQALLNSLEGEAEWVVSSGLVEEGRTPDFLEMLVEEPLKRIHPRRVTIIQ